MTGPTVAQPAPDSVDPAEPRTKGPERRGSLACARFEPVQNLFGGADYLARQLIRFGEVRLALVAYNF